MNQNFRSAFNGFNREDVVRYLEFINNKHNAQVNQLTSEAEFLRRQLDEAPQPDPDLADRAEALEADCRNLREQLSAALAEKEQLMQQVAALQAQLNAAPAPQAIPAVPDRELEAYRRAERAERVALERAELVYRQTNSILSDATAKVDSAASQIGAITEQMAAQMEQLRSAVDSSKLALRDAAATMYHIRPNSD